MSEGSQRRHGRYLNRYSRESHGAIDAIKAFGGNWSEFRNFVRVPFPRADNDPAALKANRAKPSLTWIGHATFLAQWGGLNVITDPHLTRRASPFAFAGPQRLAPLGLDFADLPPLDIALISHNHYDHLDAGSVKRLVREHPRLTFVVPLGVKSWFLRRGYTRVVELDWWQDLAIGEAAQEATVAAVPAQHFSGRSAGDRNRTLWCGYILAVAGKRLYFAGDSGYSADFADIGQRHAPIDLALLPIGAYEPNWFMRAMHVNPEEAVRMHRDVGAKLSAAMHWGTFRLTIEPLDEPPARLAKALEAAGIPPEQFFVMQHGETRWL